MSHLTPLYDHPFAPEGGILLDEGAAGSIRAALTGITLAGTETSDQPWGEWVQAGFASVHAPHLLRVHRAFREAGPREALAFEADYERRWAPPGHLAAASREAGENVLEALPGAAHAKPLHAVARAVRSGSARGYFATLFGCHAAFFNVPPAQAAVALAFLEWCGSQAPGGTPATTAFARAAADAALGDAVARALKTTLSPSDEESPFAAAS